MLKSSPRVCTAGGPAPFFCLFVFFFFEKNETISYNKMQQVTHIDCKVERLQVMQARAGSWAPRRGSVIHYRNNTTGL